MERRTRRTLHYGVMASPAPALPAPYVVEDCRGGLQLLSDGTVVRAPPPVFPALDGLEDGRVEWRDAVYDAERGLAVRMYKPRVEAEEVDAAVGEGKRKLPVVAFFHAGGFCVGSCTWMNFHAGCLRLAAEIPAVVASFDYRLAPEHRLPAAHEDAAAALLWLRDRLASDSGSGDPWLAAAADPRRVFVAGDSAGGNISHHLALRFGTDGLHPARIAGYVLLMPAFCSVEPTRSELDTPETAFLTRDLCDRYFRLALPAGVDKDHPFVNPFGPAGPILSTDVGRVLVVAAGRDLLRDKNVEYAERMKAAGKDVELVEFAGEEHAFFALKPASDAAGELVRVVRRFVERDGDALS